MFFVLQGVLSKGDLYACFVGVKKKEKNNL